MSYNIPPPVDRKSTRFMDQLRTCIRSRQMAYKTEQTYCRWVVGYSG